MISSYINNKCVTHTHNTHSVLFTFTAGKKRFGLKIQVKFVLLLPQPALNGAIYEAK